MIKHRLSIVAGITWLLFAPHGAMGGATFLLDSFVISPYSNPYSKNDGVCSAIVKAVFSQLNTHIDIAYRTVDSALKNLKHSKAIGVFPVYKAADLGEGVLFTDPIIPIRFFQYTLATTAMEQKFEGATLTAKPTKIYCVPRIFAKMEGLKKFLSDQGGQKIQYEQYAQSCYIKLRLGEVDAVLDEEKNAMFATAYIFDNNAMHISKSPEPVYEGNFFLIFNKELPGVMDIISRFNEALSEFKKAGEYNQIVQRFDESWAIEK